MRLSGRLTASLIAAAAGWAVGNAATAGLVLLYSRSFDWRAWSLASAAVVLAAWAFAGIPLAVSGAHFPAGPRRARAVLGAGVASCAAVSILLGPMALASDTGVVLLLVAAGQALSSGGAAMLVYCLLAGGRFPARASSASSRN